METSNLNSGLNWTDPITQIGNEFPSEITVSGTKFVVQKPKRIFLVNIATMDEISRLVMDKEPYGFYMEYPKLSMLSGKTDEEINHILKNEGRKEEYPGQPGCLVWAHHWLIEYMKGNFNVSVIPGEPLLFISPEAIANRFSYVENYFNKVMIENIDIGQVRDRIVRCVVWHELGHVCFERYDKPCELRLSEGLANFSVFALMDGLGKQVLHILASSPDMDFRRNYYHLLRYYGPALDKIIISYLNGNRGEAFSIFEQIRRFAEAYNAVETNGGALRIGGEITGDIWLAYGATKKNLAIAEKLPVLCNIKSGVVIANKIGRIVGFLNEDIKVIAHEIESHEYPRLPTNIKVVDKAELDIERVVREEIMLNKRNEEDVVKPFFV